MKTSTTLRLVLLSAVLGLVSCSSTGFTALLKLDDGTDKKTQLLEIVRSSREDQIATQAKFVSAFSLYSQLVRPGEEAEMEEVYDDFRNEVDDCAEQVEVLAERIEELRTASTDLFEGWGNELEQFSNPRMRAKSEAMLIDSEKRFERLMGHLEGTYTKMDQVLVGFRDYILFFNHNLNIRALSTLEEENARFVGQVRELKDEIAATRAEADSFIAAIEGPRLGTVGTAATE